MFNRQNSHFLQNELTFCENVADGYRAHYAIWQYRRYLLDLLGMEYITADLIHIESWLCSHPTDSSGWSYVGWLLQRLTNAVTQGLTTQENFDRPSLKQMLFDRLRSVSDSIELYPERECLWMFKRTLLCLLRDLENTAYIPHLPSDQTDVTWLTVADRVSTLIASNGRMRPFRSVFSFLSWCHTHGLCPALSELSWPEVLRWRHILFLVRHTALLHSDCSAPADGVQTFRK